MLLGQLGGIDLKRGGSGVAALQKFTPMYGTRVGPNVSLQNQITTSAHITAVGLGRIQQQPLSLNRSISAKNIKFIHVYTSKVIASQMPKAGRFLRFLRQSVETHIKIEQFDALTAAADCHKFINM